MTTLPWAVLYGHLLVFGYLPCVSNMYYCVAFLLNVSRFWLALAHNQYHSMTANLLWKFHNDSSATAFS